jgi:hypothetical protein
VKSKGDLVKIAVTAGMKRRNRNRQVASSNTDAVGNENSGVV